MRESRTYGFVRGVPGDQHPYRDSQTVLFELSLSGNFPLWARGVLVWAQYLSDCCQLHTELGSLPLQCEQLSFRPLVSFSGSTLDTC